MKDLKQRAIRSGFARLLGRALDFIFRIFYLVIMARLLDPEDFGLVGMVIVITNFYGMFTSAGLSSATIQKDTISNEQISTLFWINMIVGFSLTCLCLVTAPILVRFYNEPRLLWITVVAATSFLFGAASVQHAAVLQREMRFVTLTIIDVLSRFISVAIGIGMAVGGYSYWSLIASTVVQPAIVAVCVWTIGGWVPGLPHRNVGAHAMVRFGGTLIFERYYRLFCL